MDRLSMVLLGLRRDWSRFAVASLAPESLFAVIVLTHMAVRIQRWVFTDNFALGNLTR